MRRSLNRPVGKDVVMVNVCGKRAKKEQGRGELELCVALVRASVVAG